MNEVFYGFPRDQAGPAYFNFPHSSNQGTNQAGTSQQGGAPAGDANVQSIFEPTQNQNVSFNTSNQVLPSAQKIAPSAQKIRRDIGPDAFNQRFQGSAQQADIPPGYHIFWKDEAISFNSSSLRKRRKRPIIGLSIFVLFLSSAR